MRQFFLDLPGLAPEAEQGSKVPELLFRTQVNDPLIRQMQSDEFISVDPLSNSIH